MQLKGWVLWYDKKTNKGVIQENDGYQYFVHSSDLVDLAYLDGGDIVVFEKEQTEQGLQAKKVKLDPDEECRGCSDGCEECCMHDEWDYDQCINCGKERCPGIAIDRAMDYFEDR